MTGSGNFSWPRSGGRVLRSPLCFSCRNISILTISKIFSETLLPEGLLCSRDIGWVKENDVWIVSVSVRLSVCPCVDVDKLLKSVILCLLVCIFQVWKSQPGFDFKSRIVHNSAFENLAQFRFSNFRQSIELFKHNSPSGHLVLQV